LLRFKLQFEPQYWSREPKGCGLFAEVRNELSAGTARQTTIYCTIINTRKMQKPRLTGRGFCNKKEERKK